MSPTVLAHYNPNRPTIISADASNAGLGAVLFQVQDDGQRRPVCCASGSLSDTEKLYAVIEKEALATTWASERFSDYVLDIPFTLETDHKPLTVLLNSSELSKMPPASFVSAWDLWDTTIEFNVYQQNIKSPQIHLLTTTRTTSCPPATPNRLQQIRDALKTDEECSL